MTRALSPDLEAATCRAGGSVRVRRDIALGRQQVRGSRCFPCTDRPKHNLSVVSLLSTTDIENSHVDPRSVTAPIVQQPTFHAVVCLVPV